MYFIVVKDTFFDQLELCVDRICPVVPLGDSIVSIHVVVGHQSRLVSKKNVLPQSFSLPTESFASE